MRTKGKTNADRSVVNSRNKGSLFSNVNSGAKTSGKVLIANHHTATIVLPRTGKNRVTVPPLNLLQGSITPVDAKEWSIRKTAPVIVYYMGKGVIEEIKPKDQDRNISTDPHTSDLIIPDHLKNEEELVGNAGIGKAKVKRSDRGIITI